jgi:hypothetical protein
MEQAIIDPAQVKGWGIDADPKNDPTYPMRTRTGEEHVGYRWERPPLQPRTVEVLHSNERPNVSAVFGTSTPPSGLSGMLRRAAFQYSESSFGHWLPLMLADRISVMEGFLGDVGRGHFPNIFVERGGKAEWKYNRTAVMVPALLGAALASAALIYLYQRRPTEERSRARRLPARPDAA